MMLPETAPVPELANAALFANCFGITATTKDGTPALLAVVDEQGNILESGPHVARAAWLIMLRAWNNFLEGKGHLKVRIPSATA